MRVSDVWPWLMLQCERTLEPSACHKESYITFVMAHQNNSVNIQKLSKFFFTFPINSYPDQKLNCASKADQTCWDAAIFMNLFSWVEVDGYVSLDLKSMGMITETTVQMMTSYDERTFGNLHLETFDGIENQPHLMPQDSCLQSLNKTRTNLIIFFDIIL